MLRPGGEPTNKMNKVLCGLLVVIFLSSCAPTSTVAPPTATPRPISTPTSTKTPLPVSTQTVTPTSIPQTPTATQVTCDPLAVDFCITDGHFVLQRPIHPPANDLVERTYPYASTANGTRDPHHGVEFENEFGTPVYAAADGVVLFAGADEEATYSPWRNYFCYVVVIQHRDGLFTLYAHLSEINVQTREAVNSGQIIGKVGQSGVAIGSHLHFEVRRDDPENFFSTVNPEIWLMPIHQGFGTLTLSLINEGGGYQQARITLQRYSEAGRVLEAYYVDTYHTSLTTSDENAGIGDLPDGRYRITFLFNGRLYERWVEVESAKLTQVVIVVK